LLTKPSRRQGFDRLRHRCVDRRHVGDVNWPPDCLAARVDHGFNGVIARIDVHRDDGRSQGAKFLALFKADAPRGASNHDDIILK
jgi:hypothetical protein